MSYSCGNPLLSMPYLLNVKTVGLYRKIIASLTVDQLQDAEKVVANGQTIDNPTIQRLQQDLITISMQVLESFS